MVAPGKPQRGKFGEGPEASMCLLSVNVCFAKCEGQNPPDPFRPLFCQSDSPQFSRHRQAACEQVPSKLSPDDVDEI